MAPGAAFAFAFAFTQILFLFLLVLVLPLRGSTGGASEDLGRELQPPHGRKVPRSRPLEKRVRLRVALLGGEPDARGEMSSRRERRRGEFPSFFFSGRGGRASSRRRKTSVPAAAVASPHQEPGGGAAQRLRVGALPVAVGVDAVRREHEVYPALEGGRGRRRKDGGGGRRRRRRRRRRFRPSSSSTTTATTTATRNGVCQRRRGGVPLFSAELERPKRDLSRFGGQPARRRKRPAALDVLLQHAADGGLLVRRNHPRPSLCGGERRRADPCPELDDGLPEERCRGQGRQQGRQDDAAVPEHCADAHFRARQAARALDEADGEIAHLHRNFLGLLDLPPGGLRELLLDSGAVQEALYSYSDHRIKGERIASLPLLSLPELEKNGVLFFSFLLLLHKKVFRSFPFFFLLPLSFPPPPLQFSRPPTASKRAPRRPRGQERRPAPPAASPPLPRRGGRRVLLLLLLPRRCCRCCRETGRARAAPRPTAGGSASARGGRRARRRRRRCGRRRRRFVLLLLLSKSPGLLLPLPRGPRRRWAESAGVVVGRGVSSAAPPPPLARRGLPLRSCRRRCSRSLRRREGGRPVAGGRRPLEEGAEEAEEAEAEAEEEAAAAAAEAATTAATRATVVAAVAAAPAAAKSSLRPPLLPVLVTTSKPLLPPRVLRSGRGRRTCYIFVCVFWGRG